MPATPTPKARGSWPTARVSMASAPCWTVSAEARTTEPRPLPGPVSSPWGMGGGPSRVPAEHAPAGVREARCSSRESGGTAPTRGRRVHGEGVVVDGDHDPLAILGSEGTGGTRPRSFGPPVVDTGAGGGGGARIAVDPGAPPVPGDAEYASPMRRSIPGERVRTRIGADGAVAVPPGLGRHAGPAPWPGGRSPVPGTPAAPAESEVRRAAGSPARNSMS